MKWLKWTLFTIGALLILLVVLVGTFLATFDANAYKAEIAAVVKQQTGRELSIPSDIGVSLFPWLGFESGQVILGNAAGFGDQPFAEIGAVRVKVALLPLLKQTLRVDVIELAGLRLNLERRADGTGNWDDLAGDRAPAAESEQPTPADPAGKPSGPPIAALALGGIEVTNAAVSYRDAQSGQALTLRDVSLTTSAITLDEPFDLTIGMTTDVQQPALTVRLDLASEVALDLAAQRYVLNDIALKADLKGEPVPSGRLPVSLGGNITADMQSQVVTIDDLRLVTDFLTMMIEGRLSGLDQDPRFAFNLDLPSFNARQALADLKLAELDMADPQALTRVGAAAKVSGTASAIDLETLVVTLDDTRIEASATVSALDKPDALPVVRAKASVDRIDVDRYLPPESEADAAAGSGTGQGSGAAAETPIGLPVELLRKLDLETTLKVAAATVMKLRATDMDARLSVKRGVASLEPLTLALYDGNFKGNAQVDVRGKEPRYSSAAQLKGVQAGPLLKDYMGDDKLSGRGETSFAINTRGDTVGALKRGLNGPVSMAFRDGAIKDFNLAEVLREAEARIKGQSYQSSGTRSTDFSSLTVSGKFTDGVMKSDDLDLRSPLLRVGGKGKVDVGRETLNYLAVVTITADTTGQGGAGVEDLSGVPIPVRVKGSFEDPKVKIELAKALEKRARKELEAKTEAEKQRLKEELDRKAREEQEKAEEKLKKSLEDKLKKLF